MDDRKNCCGLMVLLTFFIGIILGVFISPDSGSNNRLKLKSRMDNLVDGFQKSMEKFLNYVKSLNLDCKQHKEGESIVKETIDKADQIMNEI